jgi:hypothetical protein
VSLSPASSVGYKWTGWRGTATASSAESRLGGCCSHLPHEARTQAQLPDGWQVDDAKHFDGADFVPLDLQDSEGGQVCLGNVLHQARPLCRDYND